MATHSTTVAWKSHGQRNLVDYSLWGCQESDRTERLHSSVSCIAGGFFTTEALGKPHMLAAAAAAKSLQSFPTLCDPIDGSPPGSPVPGILQARTMQWVAISFSNA